VKLSALKRGTFFEPALKGGICRQAGQKDVPIATEVAPAPGEGCFFGRPDDHFSGFKWQKAPAAQLGKSDCASLGDTECWTGRQQNGRQLPSRSLGGNDPRQKITLRRGLQRSEPVKLDSSALRIIFDCG
jgi:hypothetical protein